MASWSWSRVFLLSSDCKCYHSPWPWQRGLGLQQLPHPVQSGVASLFRVNLLQVLFSHTIGLTMVGRLGLKQRAQFTNNAPRLTYCPCRGNCCRWWQTVKSVSWGCCQVVVAGNWSFFPLLTLWFKRGLAWSQDKIENLAVVSRIQLRVGYVWSKEALRKSFIRDMNTHDHSKPAPSFLCSAGSRKESPHR